jgi:hypothetical protein
MLGNLIPAGSTVHEMNKWLAERFSPRRDPDEGPMYWQLLPRRYVCSSPGFVTAVTACLPPG